VTVVERSNARSVDADSLPYRPDLIVADVSFISLTKVLPAALATASPDGFDCLALVKPQFELGRRRVGKGGVVRSAEDRRDALVGVGGYVTDELGYSVLGFASSGLPGPAGNKESFAWIGPAGDPRAVSNIAAAAAEAEPGS
jgi:23S rRNA (cytidine1920-2'-O)/16S rRNA (cytidine1409-2'-O)-methyltransferase